MTSETVRMGSLSGNRRPERSEGSRARPRFFAALRCAQNDKIVGGRSERGVAYLMALVGLVVLSILGLAALRMANAQLTETRGLDRAKKLSNAALAGIEYGYYTYIYNFAEKTVPWTSAPVSLGETWFTVTIVDYPDIPDAVRVTATAHLGDDIAAETRIYRSPEIDHVFRYAICSGKELKSSKSKTIGEDGENGDVRVNGKLEWTSDEAIVNGSVWATETISSPYPIVTGTKTPGADPLEFPEIDLAYYMLIADEVYTSNQNYNQGITFPSDYYVIYVDGNVNVQRTVSGRGIIVATGTVNVSDDLTYADPATDKIVLISGKDILIKFNGITVDGFLYAHKPDNKGKVGEKNRNSVTVRGGIAGDVVEFTKDGANNTVIHDPDFADPDFCRAMHLPGFRE